MSRFRTIRRGLMTSAAGPIVYDTRFGTDATIAALTGWFTFDLNASCKRFWCDATNGLDTNSGLSSALPVKTLKKVLQLFLASGNPGDQIMLAGTGGRTYTDTGYVDVGGSLTGKKGLSLAYPSGFLCYDPASPSDTTKYGRLFGSDQPSILYTAGVGQAVVKYSNSDNTDHYFFFQGITFDGQNADGAGATWTEKHDGLCWQNCRFPTYGLDIDNASSSFGRSQTINISKCAFFGSWASGTGNNSGVYAHLVDGLWVQDCVMIHCSWKLGATRTTDPSLGGATVFGHGNYYSATNINGRFDRITYARNAADGFNIRGGAACTQIVSLREPIACNIGGFSSSAHEAPNGVTITVDDYVVLEGDDINTTTQPRGIGITTTNTLPGSYVKNAVFADNSQYGDTNNRLFDAYNGNDHNMVSITHSGTTATVTTDSAHGLNTGDHIYLAGASPSAYNVSNAAITVTSTTTFTYTMGSTPATNATAVGVYTPQVPQTLLIDGVSSYGYATTGELIGGSVPSIITLTTNNVTSDVLLPGTGNATSSSSTYPSRKTYAQLVTAMGFASESAMCDAMVEYPHLPWAQAIHGIIMPAYGRTPQYATASVPSLTGLTTPRTISW